MISQLNARAQVAFVDDSGGTSLKTTVRDVGAYFVIASVVVPAEDLDAVRAEVDALRKKYFGPGEMKSSGVGGDSDRRLRVLTDLTRLKWLGYVLAIDKREVSEGSGLIYKQPFLKFLHRKLYGTLFSTFPRLQVVADEHGSRDFMDGFESYVAGHFQPTLFDQADFRFADSTDEPMLQLADFVAGSIARVVDPTRAEHESVRGEILTLLRPRLAGIEEWPPRHRSLRPPSTEAQPEHDRAIEALSVNRTMDVLEKLEDDEDPVTGARRAVLKYLLFTQRFEGDPYVATAKLMRLVREDTRLDLSVQQFRARVIAPLRDQGIIIASSSKGYKLPTSLRDIQDFVDHDLSILRPLTARLGMARRAVLLGTANTVDILAGDRYQYLRDVVAVDEAIGALRSPDDSAQGG